MANGVPATFGFGSLCTPVGQYYFDKPNDGAVPVYSVKDVPRATLYEFHLDHTDMNQWDEVFANTCNLLQEPAIGPPCAQQIHNTSSSSGMISSAARNATDNAQAPVAFGPASMLYLDAGQSGQTPVAVPPSSSATLSLFSGQPVSTTLIDPQGQPVDTAATTAYNTSTTQQDGTTVTSYALSDPLPGTWTVVMTNTSTTSSTMGTLTSSFDTPLALSGRALSVIAPGATLPLTATVMTGTAPLDGMAITATVLISGAAPLQTTLLGLGNGAYSGSVTIPVTATGIASVVFAASGTTNGTPYALTTDASSQVSGGQATIDARINEQVVVDEGNSLYSALLITPTVTVPQTGTYELSGELIDRNGNLVASATSALTLTAGMATPASLSFDGRAISNSGHDGPYTLQNLGLYNADTSAPLITPQTPYTTAAYQASQFEHPALMVAPTASSAAADPNADGLFQDLAVTATLQASQPATYTVSAVLIDPAQAVITVTAESALLGTTPQAVRLDFPGQAIADHGVDGPYQVIGFTVRRADGSIVALVDALTTTGPYHAAQFASSSGGNATETPTAQAATGTSTAMPTTMPSSTPTSVPSVTATATASLTATEAPTSSPTSATATGTATTTSSNTPTPVGSSMPTATSTALPATSTATPTGTTKPTATSTSTPTSAPSVTAMDTATGTAIPAATMPTAATPTSPSSPPTSTPTVTVTVKPVPPTSTPTQSNPAVSTPTGTISSPSTTIPSSTASSPLPPVPTATTSPPSATATSKSGGTATPTTGVPVTPTRPTPTPMGSGRPKHPVPPLRVTVQVQPRRIIVGKLVRITIRTTTGAHVVVRVAIPTTTVNVVKVRGHKRRVVHHHLQVLLTLRGVAMHGMFAKRLVLSYNVRRATSAVVLVQVGLGRRTGSAQESVTLLPRGRSHPSVRR